MSNAEKLFVITKKGDLWVLSLKLGGHFRVIAESFDSKIKTGANIEFFQFKLPPEEAEGLIIVEYYQSPGLWGTCFITFNTKNEKVFNLREGIFIPKDGKVLNIINHYLEVVCDDGKRIFTSNPVVDPGKQYVNSSLLCRFVHDLPLQAVIDTVCDEKREDDALAEAAKLRKLLEEANNKLFAAGERYMNLQKKFEGTEKWAESAVQDVDNAEKKYANMVIKLEKECWDNVNILLSIKRRLEENDTWRKRKKCLPEIRDLVLGAYKLPPLKTAF